MQFRRKAETERCELVLTCLICPKRYVEVGKSTPPTASLFRARLWLLSEHSRGKLQYHLNDLFLCGCVGELGQYWLCLLHEGKGQFALDYLLYLQDFDSMEHFKAELIDYLDYYNNRRIKLKLKGLTPAQHRYQALQVA